MSGTRPARPWLFPLNPLYRLALAGRELRLRAGWEQVLRLRFPVISVGNLSTGGAGKTPFTIAMAKALTARGYDVDVLSRGYGRKDRGPARVKPAGTADEFGDEPLLIAREAGVPVYVAAQRYQAGLLAETAPDCDDRMRVHILDDAFQHRQLHRDLDILLLNREDWRGSLLPSGNLREPLSAVFRADVIVIPESENALESELRKAGWGGPVWRLRRRMEVPQPGGPAFAFCGIARPEQFFAGLESSGVRVAGRFSFRDHHCYTVADLERIQSVARSSGAVALITTAKDRVRLAPLTFELPILTAGLRIEIGDQEAALDWLAHRLAGKAACPPL